MSQTSGFTTCVTHNLKALSYLSQLHELADLRHPGQEPLVDLQGLLAVALLHLEVFLYGNKEEAQLVATANFGLCFCHQESR